MKLIYEYDPYQPVEIKIPADADEALAALLAGNERFAEIVDRMHRVTLGEKVKSPQIIPVSPTSLGLPLWAEGTPDQATRHLMNMGEDDSRPIYQAVGCPRCDNQGYRGRMAIMELFKLDAETDELIARRATGRELRTAASRKGFRTLADDAVSRVLAGLTSLEEISRVVDLTDRVI